MKTVFKNAILLISALVTDTVKCDATTQQAIAGDADWASIRLLRDGSWPSNFYQ